MLKTKTTFPVVLLLAVALAGFRVEPEMLPEPDQQAVQLQPGPCPNGHIALTYDDGPNPAWTPLILDALKERSAHAMFLIVGNNGANNRDLLGRQVAEYHQIGSHMYNHERVPELSDEEIIRSVIRTNEVIHSVGYEAKYLRFPFGARNEHVTQVIEGTGMMITPSGRGVGASDWDGPPPADTIIDRVLSGIQEQTGAIIVLHDGWAHNDRSQTVLATPRIIDEARSMGYCFGALNDAGNVVPATGRNITFGDEDSGVPNYAREGATFLDWVWAQVAFDSHEEFLGHVRELVYAWEEEGLFTRDERQAVLIAAMHSDVGR